MERQIIGDIVVETRAVIVKQKEAAPVVTNPDIVVKLGRGSDVGQMVANGELNPHVEIVSGTHPKSILRGTAQDLVLIHATNKIPIVSVVAAKDGLMKSVDAPTQTRTDIGQTLIKEYARLVDFQPSIIHVVLV
jgi:hypothetical protein